MSTQSFYASHPPMLVSFSGLLYVMFFFFHLHFSLFFSDVVAFQGLRTFARYMQFSVCVPRTPVPPFFKIVGSSLNCISSLQSFSFLFDFTFHLLLSIQSVKIICKEILVVVNVAINCGELVSILIGSEATTHEFIYEVIHDDTTGDVTLQPSYTVSSGRNILCRPQSSTSKIRPPAVH